MFSAELQVRQERQWIAGVAAQDLYMYNIHGRLANATRRKQSGEHERMDTRARDDDRRLSGVARVSVQRRRPSTGFSNAGLTRGTSAGVPGDGRPSALRSDGRVPSARRQRRPWLETVQVAVCYCDDTRAPDGNYRERRERWRAGRRDSKTHNTTEDRRVDSVSLFSSSRGQIQTL